MKRKLKINMYVKGLNIKGQGVGSAAIEQIELVKSIEEFDVSVNGKHKNKYDIRHVHTINPSHKRKMSNHKAVNICYVHFIPEENDGSLKMPHWMFKIYKKWTLSIYKKADELVVVNPYFINDLLKIGASKDNITYIPNYVSKERFYEIDKSKKAEIRKDFNLKEEDFVILGVGQTQTRKGIIDFGKVAESNPNIKFIWAGGFSFGKLTAGYDEIKKLIDNPPKNLTFLGIIDREKMNNLYNACDVLFLPSFQELMPMTILECVNTNTPFVVRNLDLYKDIFLSTYLVGKNNEEFSNLINKLKDDKEFYQKASLYSKDIADFYSKENVKKLWREYYLRIYKKYKISNDEIG